MKINSIVIVGGGSSGWMTAAAIAFKFPQIHLTLIESPYINNIGVGESTLGHINRYFDLLQLKDADWMPHCSATLKNSIQFTDFYKKNTVFQYPFGSTEPPPLNDDYGNIFNSSITPYQPINNIADYFAVKVHYPQLSYQDFARYFNFNTILAETNKQPGYDIENFRFHYDTAYHLNADQFGQYLRQTFCKDIQHIQDHVVDVKVDDKGVSEIITENHKFSADFYIDCSGFKSILIEQALKVPFINFKYLINDQAVAARIDYQSEKDKAQKIVNVTDCTAIDHGWVWNTPLWDRVGRGYVYSSQFLTKDDAEEEFRKYLKWDGPVRHIKFRHGYHEKAWFKNVLSIGLSYGFIEPLEATGLMTTHENICKFIHILENHDCHVQSIDRTVYNNACRTDTCHMMDFVVMHYALSRRNDTDYWHYLTEEVDYDKHNATEFKSTFNVARDLEMILTHNTFDWHGWQGILYILAGMNYDPTTADYLKHVSYQSDQIYNYKYNFIQEIISRRFINTLSLPTNYEFLKQGIYSAYT